MNHSSKTPEKFVPTSPSRVIAKQIFKADLPEEFVKNLPDQTLYAVLKLNGVSSSADLIELLNPDQIRHLLDFDLWDRDNFCEEHFFEWLAVCDSAQELSLLSHVLSGIDFKLVAFLMTKYVEVHIQTEATDEPPDIGYRSPDRGYTWLKIDTTDADKEFYLGRLLAQIFESNAELFYQLIGVSQNTTPTELEEESFQDKVKRLSAIGIPDQELAASLHQAMSDSELQEKSVTSKSTYRDLSAVEPYVAGAETLQPLGALLDLIHSDSPWKEELTYILNAAIVFWNIPFYESEQVELLSAQVKGLINIGLELSLGSSELDQIYENYQLVGLYRRGLSQMYDLKNLAFKVPNGTLEAMDPLSVEFGLIAHLREPLPRCTVRYQKFGFQNEDAQGDSDEVLEEPAAIVDLATVRDLRAWLKTLV